MRRYWVEVHSGCGTAKKFFSTSRNARKHLRDNVAPSAAARCIVYRGETDPTVVSACAYQRDGTIKYIVW